MTYPSTHFHNCLFCCSLIILSVNMNSKFCIPVNGLQSNYLTLDISPSSQIVFQNICLHHKKFQITKKKKSLNHPSSKNLVGCFFFRHCG